MPSNPPNHEVSAGATLGPTLSLERFPTKESERFGSAFAVIEPWAKYPYPASLLAAYFAREEPRAPRFALRQENELVGVVGVRFEWLRGPYLQFLGILPAYQGQGLGGAVVQWLERESRKSGEQNLWTCASDFNATALRFYERRGFQRIATIEGLVRDDRNEILLRKRL